VVKCVKRDDPKGEQFAAKLIKHGANDSAIPELECGKLLDHPNITKVLESFIGSEYEGTVMVMNILPGNNLADAHYEKFYKDKKCTMIPKAIIVD
jgi:hypothetical protein